ncbi:MAG TPA: [protein-PII] uridylyltransferase [Hyphomicrobiaceae bacterium]|nr:[protein-PII] uridylyltransferase [Hyphomicrobiaceae bacterium]
MDTLANDALAPEREAHRLLEPPYFDPAALRHELTAIFRAHDESAEMARSAIVERLRLLMSDARAAAHAQLLHDGKGRRCAEGLSTFMDELIALLFDYTRAHVYRSNNPADTERLTIVATGGYGRALLAPGSDIDLLFLLPYKQTPWGESVVEYILYVLWDLRLKVGHATRTVDQCLQLGRTDVTICTALLDARYILGDRPLFDELVRRFSQEVVKGGERAFIAAKLAERDSRHGRAGGSRYRVEPNIKDGKGGLRDLHTLYWLAKYLAGGPGVGDPIVQPIFTSEEQTTFRRCEDFLWTVRCHLHFLTGRPEERLTFEYQPQLAAILGYASRLGLKSVERFMKHYFMVAKDVGDLTTVLCSWLEVQQLKLSPAFDALFDPMGWRMRRRVRRTTAFRIDNGRLNVADPDVFRRDPVNLIRYFAQVEETGSLLHPQAIRLIRQSLRLIDDNLRNDPEANRIMLSLMTARGTPELTLRRMNEAGVLGRMIPEFGRVVAMMQFNLYHHYTVDEHLIRTVGVVSEIERGESADKHPLSHDIFKTLINRRVLYVTAFLHDIGKGRAEDHSKLGARIARQVCPRLGLSEAETELVAWLIENHLLMSNIAQSRDIADPKTIRDFADTMQSVERLRLLLMLTVADIRAVGPGTWNGWKGQLLRSLYYATEPLLSGAYEPLAVSERVDTAIEAFRIAAKDAPDELVSKFVDRHYNDYWIKTSLPKQLEHMRLIEETEAAGKKFGTSFTTNAFTAVSELSLIAPNHPRVLSLFAGACAAAGANIVGAYIASTRDGFALDTFLLQRAFEQEDDERRRASRIAKSIERLLRGEVRLGTLMGKKFAAPSIINTFTVDPEVMIDNVVSDHFTVIEVSGLDRPGLLYDVTTALSDLNLDINSAHITTFGEKAVDTFYVTDLTRKKITSPQRQEAIRARLIDALTGDPPA